MFNANQCLLITIASIQLKLERAARVWFVNKRFIISPMFGSFYDQKKVFQSDVHPWLLCFEAFVLQTDRQFGQFCV